MMWESQCLWSTGGDRMLGGGGDCTGGVESAEWGSWKVRGWS
jgi:hypothetical protein